MSDTPNRHLHVASFLTDPSSPSGAIVGPVFISPSGARTAAEARSRVLRLSYALTASCDLKPGDRICTLADSTPEHVEVMLAATAAGALVAPLNWRWTVSETLYAMQLVGARIVVADAAHAALAFDVLKQQVWEGGNQAAQLVLLGDYEFATYPMTKMPGYEIRSAEQLISTISGVDRVGVLESLPLQQPPEGGAFLIFTSGTTGPPRAALLSHAAMHLQCANKLQCCGYGACDIYLHTAPLFHVGGLCSALAMLMAGARHVFLPTFSAAAAVDAIHTYRVTSFIAVPTMAEDIIAAASGREMQSMQTILLGAGATSRSLLDQLATVFPNATIYSAYGMTECCSSITFSVLRQPAFKSRRCRGVQLTNPPSNTIIRPTDDSRGAIYAGVPAPGVEIGVLTSGVGEIEPGTVSRINDEGWGEVVTRGLHVMIRYWADSESTGQAFLADGWLRTGDVGRIEAVLGKSQVLYLMGRVKDVVKTGGENVAAAEVERSLMMHPGVALAAVVGLPHRRLGEIVSAAVVLRDGWQWTGPRLQISLPSINTGSKRSTVNYSGQEQDPNSREIDLPLLQAHCRQCGLAGFKVPRVIAVMDSLPLNATGKVKKPILKEELTKMYGKRDPTTQMSKL